MNLEKLVSVTGRINGIFKVAGNRNNGLIIEDLQSGKRKFASSRGNQFTPLESIGIYTDDGESVELKVVFRNMQQQREDNPPISPDASQEELREYFFDVLPNHDPERVYTRDIKRVIKWFNLLEEKGYLKEEEPATETEESTTEEPALEETAAEETTDSAAEEEEK